jgi:hypothetical protein
MCVTGGMDIWTGFVDFRVDCKCGSVDGFISDHYFSVFVDED